MRIHVHAFFEGAICIRQHIVQKPKTKISRCKELRPLPRAKNAMVHPLLQYKQIACTELCLSLLKVVRLFAVRTK